jgi:SAM-dependent methyltransferase
VALSPFWWFGLVVVGLAYFLFLSPRYRLRVRFRLLGPVMALLLLAIMGLASFKLIYNDFEGQKDVRQTWSPYNRIDYKPRDLSLSVNLMFHQSMVTRNANYPAYALPHLLNRDSGNQPYGDVMIIGAGSGNDVSRALQWGAKHVDAVEIDPAIYKLGTLYHPDRPYQDPRVEIHLDDGRNFLRASKRNYDLVIYALVDSLVLHSGYSNIRLESYLFTRQTFEDVKRHLKPGGTFVVYNYFRELADFPLRSFGWFWRRQSSGDDVPVSPGDRRRKTPLTNYGLRRSTSACEMLSQHSEYALRDDEAPGPNSPNGFRQQAPRWQPGSDAGSAGSLGEVWVAGDPAGGRFARSYRRLAILLRTQANDAEFEFARNGSDGRSGAPADLSVCPRHGAKEKRSRGGSNSLNLQMFFWVRASC